mgnify:CR=1 FL=1
MSYLDTYLGQLDAALSDPAVMELAIKRPFNSLGCIVCRSGLYSLPFLAEERQDALENQY